MIETLLTTCDLSKRLKDVKRCGGLSIKAHFSCLNKLGQEMKNYGSKRGVKKAYYALIKKPTMEI